MPKEDITHYSDYFNKNAPHSVVQAVLLLILGVVTGAAAGLIIHYQQVQAGADIVQLLLYGASSGIMVISIPALLTAISVKITTRRMLLKHIMLIVVVTAGVYAAFILASSASFAFIKSYNLAYVLIILANAAIYGFWIFPERVVMARNKSSMFTSAVQPMLNILFYIPFGKYILSFNAPVSAIAMKLYAGMLVFLAIAYLSLYLVDRPLKKATSISSVKLLTVMVNQWLYNINVDVNFLGHNGVKTDVPVDVLALRSGGQYKAVFVRPAIHYGPFMNVGGSIATNSIGTMLSKKYGAIPFVLHGPVSLSENPISTMQVDRLCKELDAHIAALSGCAFRRAKGSVSIGRGGPCKAISIRIGESGFVVLTKAPFVTEDIASELGPRYL